ncbi:hypothetical protein BG004_006981 [Podila humilis]|nr:hypothetical protein BG004_006981 [Podila humilis]
MSRKNSGYQLIPESNSTGNTPTDQQHAPATVLSTSSNPTTTAAPTLGSAGVPPKIINPTKQAFQQSHQLQSPIHQQIPGAATVTAKANAAAAASAAGASASGAGSAGSTGSGGQSRAPGTLGVSTALNLPSTGAVASSHAALNLRGKVKQPMRTTKTSQKLTLFPEEKDVPVLEDEYAFDDTTYNQIGQLSSSIMDDLFNYLLSRKITNGAVPKRFDECIYTPFSYTVTSKPPLATDRLAMDEFDTDANRHAQQQQMKESTPEVFYFDYGVVVIWGMSEQEETRLLQELSRFEEEKLDDEDVETEEFSFHYNSQFQPRIYNDVITLKSAGNYMVKLTISHAIAQSVKMTLFEGLIENTINATKNIPQTMAETGKVPMSRTAITKKIGQLFIMRINVNLVSNILDTPEIFWSEPSFQPLYSAIRGYLEIGQRVELLNQRTAVISDLLDMLKEHLTSSHGEQLEWIVIILIFFEIVIGVITICLDAVSFSRGGGHKLQ